ncbi:MAG TPA: tRNA lysidine(34) synthetase TilS [Chthoniobacteraceae bacterium]|nr:tRNA lysidine(34) synthetase TilS [Chthoniobacteraceae bacterium]
MKIDFSSLDPKRPCLVGVSGGRDSVALLHLLLDTGFTRLIVCHLDHRLRGRASRADAAFVAKLAKRHNLEAVIGKADVRGIAKKKRISIETAAREARYAFFASVARRKKCRMIFLAHHADDQVETFLFNLFRGAGQAGLGAMRADTSRKIGGVTLRILRPLLPVWRAEIDGYLTARGLKYREDATNTTTVPLRNRMRHEIIPALENWFGRDIRKSIRRTAEILAVEHDWLTLLTPKPGRQLSVRDLRKMPAAQQRRFIHAWLKLMRVGDAGFDEIESVRSLLPASAKAAKINLPGNLHAHRRAGTIFLEKGK